MTKADVIKGKKSKGLYEAGGHGGGFGGGGFHGGFGYPRGGVEALGVGYPYLDYPYCQNEWDNGVVNYAPPVLSPFMQRLRRPINIENPYSESLFV